MNTKNLMSLAAALFAMLATGAGAQTSNVFVSVAAPATMLEEIESSPSQLIVKSTAPVGVVYFNGGGVSATCKEDFLPASGRKEQGLQLDVQLQNQPADRAILDYDELDPFIDALDYLTKINWTVTSLGSFDASYTTKAGFRIAAYSSKRSGQIQYSIRSPRMSRSVTLAPDQWSQFRAVLDQARGKLTTLRQAG
jgi:hypothetical protein